MKKSLLALAVLGAFATAASAQTSVSIYGRMDIGLVKVTDQDTAINGGTNSVIGFRGTEDLGGGLTALFQAEMRFSPDTGRAEANDRRPLFQGQTRVGLKGDFGTIRLGRGLTAVQEPIGGFDPFATQTVGQLLSTQMGGYNSTPLQAGSAGNRFDNALFYNSPSFSGLQFNATVAAKESVTSVAPNGSYTSNALNSTPYSLSTTYSNGPIAAMIGYERNQIEDKFWNLSASYDLGMAKIMGTYSNTQDATTDSDTRGWGLGASMPVGAGSVKVGYGQVRPDGADSIKKGSIGYWHTLSKRTYLYTDYARIDNGDNINAFDVGIHHNF